MLYVTCTVQHDSMFIKKASPQAKINCGQPTKINQVEEMLFNVI
ncbi:hypothetical protein [Staphylococcus caprae]